MEIHNKRVDAENMISRMDTSHNWELIRQKNRMMEFQPHVTAEDLHKLNVPVLVISTDRDVVEEEHTFFIYKNIPKVNLSIISEESHYVVRRNPELFNSVVFKFLIEPYRINSFRFDK